MTAFFWVRSSTGKRTVEIALGQALMKIDYTITTEGTSALEFSSKFSKPLRATTPNHCSPTCFPLDPRDIAEIRRVLKPLLEQIQAQLILFGSRARGEARRASDIDLAVRAEQAIPNWLLAEMRERLEESHIPVRVDLIDYATAPEELKRAIDQEGIVWPR